VEREWAVSAGHVNANAEAGQQEAPPRILVAEDNPDSRDALRALLEVYGFRVLEAVDGREAIHRALREAPDLILMDIMMPGMDGLEATRRLRASPEFRQVPIVALTAMAGARELALAAGCDDYLPKPIDIPVLLRTMRDWIRKGHQVG
jgi:CheY-like chemotaxis protein